MFRMVLESWICPSVCGVAGLLSSHVMCDFGRTSWSVMCFLITLVKVLNRLWKGCTVHSLEAGWGWKEGHLALPSLLRMERKQCRGLVEICLKFLKVFTSMNNPVWGFVCLGVSYLYWASRSPVNPRGLLFVSFICFTWLKNPNTVASWLAFFCVAFSLCILSEKRKILIW